MIESPNPWVATLPSSSPLPPPATHTASAILRPGVRLFSMLRSRVTRTETQQNAAMVEETAVTAALMSDKAQQLTRAVARFRVE